jgi:serine protease Do
MVKVLVSSVVALACLALSASDDVFAKGKSGGNKGGGPKPGPSAFNKPHPPHHHHHHHHHRRVVIINGVEVEVEAAEEATVEAAEYGVLITDVAKNSPAERAGLEEDDIILSFDGKATPTFDALAAAVQQAGRRAEVLVLRDETGARERITITIINRRIGVTGQGTRVE